jgi:competence protein ComEC
MTVFGHCLKPGTTSQGVPLRWHADADHYDGLPDVLDRFAIGAVLVPPGFDSGGANPGAVELLAMVRARGVPVRTLARGDRWELGQAGRVIVRHPPRDWSTGMAGDNARSIVLDVAEHGRHAWLTGDLDGVGLTSLVATPPGGPVDLFLAPHHGGRTANPDWLYDWARPAQVVVSQRPPAPGSRDPLATLDARGIHLLRTWQRGAIRLRWTRLGIEARGFRDEPPEVDTEGRSESRGRVWR